MDAAALPAPPNALTSAVRVAALAAMLAATVHILPQLPGVAAAFLCLALGALVALPDMVGAALRRGLALAQFRQHGLMHRWAGGPILRVLGLGALGIAMAALALVRLVEGDQSLRALALAALPLAVLMLLPARRAVAGVVVLHAGRHARRLARWAAVALLLAVHFALGWAGFLPAPTLEPVAATSPLVAEGLALARLWAGLEGYALGLVSEFGDWGRAWALVAVTLGQGGIYWALASAALAMTLTRADLRRAAAPASNAAEPAAPGRGMAVLAGLAALVCLGAALGADRVLGSLPVAQRPVSQAQVAAERIGGELYRSGTRDALLAARSAAIADEAQLLAALRAALDAGFGAMEGNVDPFLDGYYTLTGEYTRLFFWVTGGWATGGLEAYLADDLHEALMTGAPFAAFDELAATVRQRLAEQQAALAETERAILAQNRVEGVNPGRLRIEGEYAAMHGFRSVLATELARSQLRWGGAVGAGVIAGAMARRVTARLAQRGTLRVAAAALSRVAGLVVAVGVDLALVELDEHLNRADLRADILTEIRAQREAALAALPGAP